MSFFNIPTENELPEQQPVPAGEYELQILSATKKDGVSKKNQQPYSSINITLQIISQPDAKNIYHTIFLPKEGDKPEDVNQFYRRVRAFLRAFKLPLEFDPENLDNWVGATGFAILSLDSDEEYGERNNVKRF